MTCTVHKSALRERNRQPNDLGYCVSARARGCGHGRVRLRAEFSTGDRCTLLSERAGENNESRVKGYREDFWGSSLQISILVRYALAFTSRLSIQSYWVTEWRRECFRSLRHTSHTASDTRRSMDPLGQRVSEVCVCSASVRPIGSLRLLMSVYVCVLSSSQRFAELLHFSVPREDCWL